MSEASEDSVPAPKLTAREVEILRQATLDARVHTLEASSAALTAQSVELRADVTELKTGLRNLNTYLSGDPTRKEDTGKLGELFAMAQAQGQKLSTVLGAIATQLLLIIGGILVYFFTHGR